MQKKKNLDTPDGINGKTYDVGCEDNIWVYMRISRNEKRQKKYHK